MHTYQHGTNPVPKLRAALSATPALQLPTTYPPTYIHPNLDGLVKAFVLIDRLAQMENSMGQEVREAGKEKLARVPYQVAPEKQYIPMYLKN